MNINYITVHKGFLSFSYTVSKILNKYSMVQTIFYFTHVGYENNGSAWKKLPSGGSISKHVSFLAQLCIC